MNVWTLWSVGIFDSTGCTQKKLAVQWRSTNVVQAVVEV